MPLGAALLINNAIGLSTLNTSKYNKNMERRLMHRAINIAIKTVLPVFHANPEFAQT